MLNYVDKENIQNLRYQTPNDKKSFNPQSTIKKDIKPNQKTTQSKNPKLEEREWNSPITELDPISSEERQKMVESLNKDSSVTSWFEFLSMEMRYSEKVPKNINFRKIFNLSTSKAIEFCGHKKTDNIDENKQILLIWRFHLMSLEMSDKKKIFKFMKNNLLLVRFSYVHYVTF